MGPLPLWANIPQGWTARNKPGPAQSYPRKPLLPPGELHHDGPHVLTGTPDHHGPRTHPYAGLPEDSALLTAFRDLPARRQGVLWYGVVDEEPDTRTAVFLGLAPGEVAYAGEAALGALRRAFLATHLPRYGTGRCQGF